MKFFMFCLAVITMTAFSFENIYLQAPTVADMATGIEISTEQINYGNAFGDDGNPGGGMVPDESSDDPFYTATLLNTWQISGNYASQALGLSYQYIGSAPSIGFTSAVDDTLYFADVDDMSKLYDSGLHASNGSAFGCVATPPEMTTTDFGTSSIFHGLWGSWDSYANPATIRSRGITSDSNNSLMWITKTEGSSGSYTQFLGSFTAEAPGTVVWYDAGSGLGGTRYLSGLTDFILSGGNTCFAYTIYNSGWVRFQEYNGSTLSYLGYAVLPVSGLDGSYGICYNSTRNSFYWSYKIGTDYFISEFSVDITSLSRSTWGEIKTSF